MAEDQHLNRVRQAWATEQKAKDALTETRTALGEAVRANQEARGHKACFLSKEMAEKMGLAFQQGALTQWLKATPRAPRIKQDGNLKRWFARANHQHQAAALRHETTTAETNRAIAEAKESGITYKALAATIERSQTTTRNRVLAHQAGNQ